LSSIDRQLCAEQGLDQTITEINPHMGSRCSLFGLGSFDFFGSALIGMESSSV